MQSLMWRSLLATVPEYLDPDHRASRRPSTRAVGTPLTLVQTMSEDNAAFFTI